jgi:hypothetical protein
MINPLLLAICAYVSAKFVDTIKILAYYIKKMVGARDISIDN